ncbi:MAG: hypothetical protein IAI50_05810, partial [Candidatus Eremiobacteraeota bacterium]|nr:hypothetical protein [Candidatus Eremiobacteraeota bacterium]
MTRLGVALLLTSATLFTLDVGGTFALDRGNEKAGESAVTVPEQPVAARVTAPLQVANSAAPVVEPQHVATTVVPMHVVTPMQ